MFRGIWIQLSFFQPMQSSVVRDAELSELRQAPTMLSELIEKKISPKYKFAQISDQHGGRHQFLNIYLHDIPTNA